MCCGIVGRKCEKGFEPRERPVRPAPVKGLTSDNIIPHAPIDSLSFSVFNHARILTSGVYGPESEAAYFTSASVYWMPRRDFMCLWGYRVRRALGPQVVCGGGVCVRVGVCALLCGLIFAVCVTRLPRVQEWK